MSGAGYTASVIGGSGFAGGEVLRLLAAHPDFEIVQATSRSYERRSIGLVHPNLRDLDLRFSDPADLESVDVLFAATPHGVSMEQIETYRGAADLVVDLSADFRLPSADEYDTWYDGHTAPDLLSEAQYALPELFRDDLSDAKIIASGGCNATVAILGLWPLRKAGILERDDRVVIDVKVGSSEGGAGGGAASSHPERSGIVRPYAPTGHRHEAEIEWILDTSVAFTAHAVDMTRGAAATAHVFPETVPETRNLWDAYRDAYEDEPFMRLVAGGGGIYRYPEPKILAGTNYCDVGFATDDAGRIVVFSALDNMMKGAAGQAVHATNVALGLEETAGLEFDGLHPVGAP